MMLMKVDLRKILDPGLDDIGAWTWNFKIDDFKSLYVPNRGLEPQQN